MAKRRLGVRPIAVILAVMAIPVLAPVSSLRAASPVVGPLSTSGNRILDGNGNPIIFRGVNIARLNTEPAIAGVPSLSEESFDNLARWGVNQVRLSLGQHFWLAAECKYVPSYASNVDAIVERLTGRGISVMISLSRSTRKRCGKADNHRMADNSSLEFWRQVAERYRTNHRVAFDLWNEPHDISWSIWKNGGYIKEDGMTWKAAGMQQMYDKVRSTGAQNLVYVSGNDWATKPPFDSWFLSGYNIVYATHRYTCIKYPPPKCTTPNPYNPAPPGKRLSRWVSISQTHPVQITEFGWPAQNSSTFNQNVISWAEERGVGWNAFSWTIDDQFALVADWITYNPTTSGTPIANGLKLNT